MPEYEQQRMDALTQANVRLLERVTELERRVAFLEGRSGERAPAAEPAAAPTPAAPEPLPAEPPRPLPEAPAAVDRPQAVETQIGLTWINRIAVLTCILAAAFFFKYAVDNEWVGPSGRVTLGVLAGLALLGSADSLWRRGHQIYAQGLCGLGIAVLYLSFQASFEFYQLLPQSAAFGLMVVVTATAGAASLRYGSQAIALLGLLGGYATPVLLSTGEKRIWFLLSYVLVLNLAALAAARRRGWSGLEWLALAGTVVLYIGGLEQPLAEGSRLPAGLFALVYWGLFAAAGNTAVFYVAHFFTGLAVFAVWDERPFGFAGALSALTAGSLGIAARRGWQLGPSVAFTTFVIAYAAWAAEVSDPEPLAAELVLLTAGFLLFLGWTPLRLARGIPAAGRDLALVVFNTAFFAGRVYSLLEPDYAGWRGLLAVALAALHLLLAYLLWRSRPAGQKDERPVLLLLGIALTLLTLAAPIQFSGYRITMAWALEGAALAWIAGRSGSRPMAGGAMFVLAITGFRLLTLDVWIYASPQEYVALWNARMYTFAVSAAAFFLASRWLAAAWPTAAPAAATIYGAGHFLLLLGLGLEVTGWAGRSVAAENVRNVSSAAISFLIAAYAVLLAAAGIATRTQLNRVFGLTLIGLVVGKLYLYDVWELRLIYRVLAFTGLGLLLLVLSFLYSRYRASIESWLQTESPSDAEPGP